MPASMNDVDFLLSRASDSVAFERWLDIARSTGWCQHPIRLAGTMHRIESGTGEIVSSYSTACEPDGHLLKACGTNRRATICEPCSARYRADAWHLIAAGLRGGKGVPEIVTTHPTLFVTLTAPSFGAVHSQRERDGSAQRCSPRRTPPCEHGRRTDCREKQLLHGSSLSHLAQPAVPLGPTSGPGPPPQPWYELPMVCDLISDPHETIDLMQADLTAGWVIGAAMGPLVALQKSAAEYRNIEVGEEGFTGYD